MASITVQPGIRKGTVQVPPSKSDAQRALLCAAFSQGTSMLHHVGRSADELSMIQAIASLGAQVIEREKGEFSVMGIKSLPNRISIDAHESGLGARLLTAVCSTGKGTVTVKGSGSLKSRTMHFFEDVLPHFGAKITDFNGHLPITVQGPLLGRDLDVDGSVSSQFISGLLMALPLADGNSRLTVADLASGPYVRMTLNTLAAFGIQIETEEMHRFSIAGGQHYQATEYTIEGDWSAASCWLTAAALGADISVKGLNTSSVQADKQMLAALMSAGCSVHVTSDGIRVNGTTKHPFEFDASDCPDLFPSLVTLAALIPGKSIIHGANRLIHKESNRALSLISEFLTLGITIEFLDNALHIHGKSTIRGGEVHAHNDHRIAMSLGICGLFSQEAILIQGSESVRKSYPTFWEEMNALAH